jgi:hypothetical protein
MKIAPSTGTFVLAIAIILSLLLCSLATIVNSVYAHPGSGLSRARDITCDGDHPKACSHICEFISGDNCPG